MHEPEHRTGWRSFALRLGFLLAVVCVCASAIAAQHVRQFAFLLLGASGWELVLAVLAALVGGGGVGGFIVRLWMAQPERRKLDVDTIGSASDIIGTLLERVKILDADVVRAREEVEKARAEATAANRRAVASDYRADAFFAEVKALREQFAAATLSLAAARIDALDDFADMWDLLEVPVVFTSEGGRWDLVNLAMCREVGCSRDELLGFGWQAYVLDLEDTMREEAAARHRSVWGYTNRWRHAADTSVAIWLEWYAAPYKDGKTMAFAFPSSQRPTRKRRRDEQPTKE